MELDDFTFNVLLYRECMSLGLEVMIMVLNANFNNISVILWLSVLFAEEIGISGENHRPATSH
jgi:hypothetical protein